MTAALFQSITSEKGNTQSLLSTTGIHAACSTSKNLQHNNTHLSCIAAAATTADDNDDDDVNNVC